MKVTFRISRNGKTIWARSRAVDTILAMNEDQVFIDWTNRRQVKRGRKVRVTSRSTSVAAS